MRRLLIVCLTIICGSTSTAAFADDQLTAWDFSSGTSGWQANAQCNIEAKGGRLVITSQGNDPFLISPATGKAGWIELTLKTRSDMNCNAQLFWATRDRDGFAENQSVRFVLRASRDKDRVTRIYFQADGPLTQFRLDPHDNTGVIEIRALTLAYREPPPPPAPQATPVDAIKTLPDFQVELLYSVPTTQQGSWVSLTHDPQGRLIASDQSGALYRVTVPKPGEAKKKTVVEKIPVDLGMAQGLLYAFDSLYVVVNDYGGNRSGLYRVQDTDGDDQFDQVTLLKKIDGKGEHGPHAVVLAPDGKSIYFCAGNHSNLIDVETSLVPQTWQEDQLLTRMWDAGGHAVGKMAPGGWIAKTDPEGKDYELVSIGFRNQYDLAFNAEGELFTYDADMEWDVGSPWYRPTRVCHVTPGSEFGWRSGTGKWPEYYPDSVGSVVDIGPGSPTGIVFGTGARFPAKYQRALFIADWSYGKIYAVHMEPQGATYRATYEQMIAASPLPVTDMVVNPVDGALYFAIGGRGTQSGLYRVTYQGSEATSPIERRATVPAERTLRRELEATLGNQSPASRDLALKRIAHPDRRVRFSARVALEQYPVAEWQEDALGLEDPHSVIQTAIALTRTADKGLQSQIVDHLAKLDMQALPVAEQLDAVRAYALALIRMGQPSPELARRVLEEVDALYPATDPRLNRELCQLLVYLEAPQVAQRTVALLANAATQEEEIAYVLALRELRSGWNAATREAYFKWFRDASLLSGGHSFSRFLVNIRNDAIGTLTAEEKASLGELLTAQPVGQVSTLPPRKFVKKWTVNELLPIVEQGLTGRDYQRGRRLFTQGACFKCHRFAGQGGIVGPDLTGVAGRFNTRNLLESMIEPSKVISDQYQSTQFALDSGKSVIGRIVNAAGDRLMVMTDMMNPDKLATVLRDEIEVMKPSSVSLMPSGLLDTYQEDEILDLMAFLKSRGDPQHEVYQSAAVPRKPNVLLVSIDDLNDWVGVLGGHPQAKTPHIDALAGRGTLFTNAHCQATVCTPSRASMVTSRLPSSTQLYFLQPHLRASAVVKHATTLAEYFAEHGYDTVGVGKIYGGQEPRYFQEYGGSFGGFGPRPKTKLSHPQGHPLWDWGAHPESDGDMPDTKITNWAIEKLHTLGDEPFLLSVGFYRPHVPMYAPKAWFQQHPRESITLPRVLLNDRGDLSQYARDLTDGFPAPRHHEIVGAGEWSHAVQAYLASCTFVDHCVGRLLDALAASKHADNTMVVLYSDHGWHLGEKQRWAKRSLWEDATRVPLVIASPGGQVARCARPVGLIDVFPTLADLCGLPADSSWEGQSLKPLLGQADLPWDRPAITTFGPNNHAVRSTDWRFIRYADGSEELYDHREDPHEWHNLAGNPSYTKILEEHARWLPKTNLPAMMEVESYGMKAYREAEAGRLKRAKQLGN